MKTNGRGNALNNGSLTLPAACYGLESSLTPAFLAVVDGTPEEIARAFRDAFLILDRRIGLFAALPLATLEQLAMKREIDNIGRS